MKTLHFLNKLMGNWLIFLKSFAGAGFNMSITTLWDMITNSLGVQVFIGMRLISAMRDLDLTPKQAFVVSMSFSVLSAFVLALLIQQAVLHKKHLYNAFFSIISFVLSSGGLLYVFFDNAFVWTSFGGLTFAQQAGIIIIFAISSISPVGYNMNASLVVSDFGDTLDKFNEASKQELEKSFTAQVATLSKEDVASTQKRSTKRLRKLGVKTEPIQAPEKSSVLVGESVDFDDMFNNLNNN